MEPEAATPEDAPESFAFRVPEAGAGERVDKVLARAFPERSRNQVQKALQAGLVSRGETPLGKKDTVRPGEVLWVAWPPDPPQTLEPAAIPLRILWEDGDLIAVDKPPGMVVHPGSGTGPDTLVHALLHHCGGALSGVGAPDRPGIVHRLDKETSGVLVAAKTDRAYHGLVRQFSGREMTKVYLAVVAGTVHPAEGSVREPIGRHPVSRVKMAVTAKGRPAHTDWRVREYLGATATLLECRIHTGRTHQIRVHCSHLRHPLLGDALYGFKGGREAWPAIPRILLHAWQLLLVHPVSGEVLRLEAPVPPDFTGVVEALRKPKEAAP